MTREEAIGNLDMIRIAFIDTVTVEQGMLIDETFITAIKALEQEPCEDAVSRQAAIDAVAFGITYATGINMETGEVSHPFAESNQELRKAIHRICELPPVNPQTKTGHWINVNEGKWNTIPAYKCSACGANADLRDWSGESPFCPWCGAKMVEPQEREGNE